jgi:FAD dependent oxidoreductase TIGR03364
VSTIGQQRRADVAIVGAGIVGLAHAVEAVERGLSVVLVERDDQACGASIRNFGHGCFTAQADEGLELALAARERWVSLARKAGFWLIESGSVVVAQAPDELAVMEEFKDRRDGHVRLLSAREVLNRLPVSDTLLVGGLEAPLDCRVNPRQSVHALARWLADAHGVEFLWHATALGVEPGRLHTSRGDVAAGAVVVAAGHDLDRLFPELADEAGLVRCALQMLRVARPTGRAIRPALLTGLSLLRYRGYASCPSLDALRCRLEQERPELVAADVNLIVTQMPGGDLVIGDTHAYARTPAPFNDETLDELILSEAGALLGLRRLHVRERWRGVYAFAPDREFLVAAPAPGVRAVAVTSGIGMTTALGLAPRVLDDLLEESS